MTEGEKQEVDEMLGLEYDENVWLGDLWAALCRKCDKGVAVNGQYVNPALCHYPDGAVVELRNKYNPSADVWSCPRKPNPNLAVIAALKEARGR